MLSYLTALLLAAHAPGVVGEGIGIKASAGSIAPLEQVEESKLLAKKKKKKKKKRGKKKNGKAAKQESAPTPEPEPVAEPAPEPVAQPAAPEPVADAPATAAPAQDAAPADSAEQTEAGAGEAAPTSEVKAVAQAPTSEVASATATSEVASEADDDAGAAKSGLGIGLWVSGLMPRGDLKPAFAVGLGVDYALGVADLGVRFQGGWSSLQQQDSVMIAGRGQTMLIQHSMVLPFDLSLRAALADVGGFKTHAALGLAVDISHNEFQAFSVPAEVQNDVAFGVVAAVGGALAAGPGALGIEIRYRETAADIGAWKSVGENIFGNFALQLGYSLSL